MLIDLTCPAEVFEAKLPTEEIPAVSLVLYNLSDRVIVSAEVTLKLLSGSGAEKDRVVYRARALNGRPYSTFPMNVPCNPCLAARKADVTVDKVWFSDNAVWRREQSSSVEYEPNSLPVSRALTNLKFVAGENAVGFPCQQNGLWICVCGRPNPDGEEYCARCRRQREAVFTRFNREAVEKQIAQRERQLDLYTRNVREDTARMQRIREEEYNLKQKRKIRRRRLAVCLPLFLALLAALFFGIVPALRLWSADRNMNSGEYAAAAATLKTLGSFPGVPERLAECEWQAAKKMYENAGDAEALRKASDALRAVEGRPESIALAEEADLARARLAVEAKDPESARMAMELLEEDDPRRTSIENDCLLLEAKTLMAEKRYAAARETFLTVADVFPEASGLAAECVYIPASALISQAKYDEAIAELSRIPDHPLSRTAILECHYRKAEAAAEAGDLQSAAAEYMMADDYGDAKARTNETVFTIAENTYAAGDTAGAQKLFASLPGYAPAEARNYECLLELAKEAVSAGQYEKAMELFSALPDGYEGTADQIPRTAYLAGTAALKNYEYEQAVSYFEQAGDYRDAPAKLAGALESLIRFKLDAGNGTDAIALLPRLTGSRNYEKYKQEAEYLVAVARAEAGGSPAELLPVFESLGSYQEAKTWVKRMCYALAEQAEERNETLDAARLYQRAGDWSDAADKAAAMYDVYYGACAASAKEAVSAGDWTLAVTLLESVDRSALPAAYTDLSELYQTACLKAGEALYQSGQPYEAARYFRLADDPKKTNKWMQNACYRILGTWTDKDGAATAVFREDSTCEIAGESFVFLVPDTYTLKIKADGEMISAFRITELTDRRLNLRDMREGHEAQYSLYRSAGSTETGDHGSTESTGSGNETGNLPDLLVRDGE